MSWRRGLGQLVVAACIRVAAACTEFAAGAYRLLLLALI